MFLRKIIAIFFFITILSLIYLLKPSLMFNKEGGIKEFGYTEEKSIITIFIAIPIIAILCYLIVLSFEIVYT